MTDKRKIAIDLDGCLCDFNTAFLSVLQSLAPNPVAPISWTAHPPVWDWFEVYGWRPEEVNLAWQYVHSESSQFWSRLKPLEWNSVRDVKTIQRKVELHVITVRTGEGVSEQTQRWLSNHGITQCQVHFTTEKTRLCQDLGIELLVDDNPENLIGFADVKKYLVHRPYNALAQGSWQRIHSVSAALRHAGITYDGNVG